MFLKNRNLISKIKRSKVTDYAALIHGLDGKSSTVLEFCIMCYVNLHVPLLVKMLFGLLFPPIRLLEEIDRMLRPTLSFYEP